MTLGVRKVIAPDGRQVTGLSRNVPWVVGGCENNSRPHGTRFLGTRALNRIRSDTTPLSVLLEDTVKRVILGLAATAAAATAAVMVPQAADATGGGSTGTGDSIYIYPYADYNLGGMSLDLDLQVKCVGGGSGTVNGSVSQSPPETASPVTLATGFSLVVCDGTAHAVGLTVDGAGYDDGKAKATVTLVNPSTLKTTTVTSQIIITAH